MVLHKYLRDNWIIHNIFNLIDLIKASVNITQFGAFFLMLQVRSFMV